MNPRFIKHLATVVLLFVIFTGKAQHSYRFTNYTINEGLSQSSVNCLVQDDQRGLWIGTQDGLNHFDGRRFHVFNAEFEEGITNSYIKAALKAPNGDLWFGTANGLIVYNPKTELFTSHLNKGQTNFSVEDLVIDQRGVLWMVVANQGLYSFDQKKKTFVSHPMTNGRKLRKLTVTNFDQRSANLLLYNEADGLVVYNSNSKKKTIVPLPTRNGIATTVSCFYTLPGIIMLGTNHGVFQLSSSDWEVVEAFPNLNERFGNIGVTSLLNTSDNTWFIGSSNRGLFSVHENGQIFQHLADTYQKNSLVSNQIQSILEVELGSIWVGTNRGVSSFDPRNQGLIGVGVSAIPENGLPDPFVWGFDETADGKFLFVGSNSGVSKIIKSTGKVVHYYWNGNSQEKDSDRAALCIYTLSDDELLVGSSEGLYHLKIFGDGYSFKPVDFIADKVASTHDVVYKIVHYKEKKYWLATRSGALLLDLGSNSVQVFEHQSKNKSKTIAPGICRLVFKDSKGTFWFSTSSGGLNVLDAKNPDSLVIRPHKSSPLLKKNIETYITSICETKNGDFWLGTMGSGLIQWNKKTNQIQRFTQKNGLSNNVVYGIICDKEGKLWMSTNGGLSVFKPQRREFTVFRETNGLMSNEFNLGAYFKSKDGTMYFGGINGFNYFNPSGVGNRGASTFVVFTKLYIDKDRIKPQENGKSVLTKPLANTELIELGYNQRNFTIHFQPNNLSNAELINYKYKLVGESEDEVFIGSSNEIHFSSLSSGTYRLEVYTRYGDGAWNTTPTSIDIIIESPIWAKWWFWALIVAFSAFIIRILIIRRIDHERREQVRLEMKIAERTREIRAQNEQIEQQKHEIEEEKQKVEYQKQLLQQEKEKSDNLLKNIIPENTMNELLTSGKARAREYKNVSVLFTDFVGFTSIADEIDDPTVLVKELDSYFREFDKIVLENSLEKIKTIGDAYMCAGGVPVRNQTNPIDTVKAGLQIQHYMAQRKERAIEEGKDYWELRLGINTGKVTAGVIGTTRYAYDIWGATVNHAQRMEMMGKPGKVTISEHTFQFIEPYFECIYLGEVETKSRGLIKMYQVEGIKQELSVDGQGVFPNDRFDQIVNLHHYSKINYYKAERHIMNVLTEGLDARLIYHSINHTLDVVKAVERIALSENVTDEGLFLLKTAATYHDAGFVEQYEKNEPIGARMAGEILPKYGYTPEHIDRIIELIYVTQIPHQPKNLLEEIICDADLDYLGRDDFHTISNKLKQELIDHGKIKDAREWDEMQVKFLTAHKYFTQTAIQTRQAKKEQNLQDVILRLEKNEY